MRNCNIIGKIGSKVDLDAIDLTGRTALQWAALNGCEKIVKVLLYAGANPDIPN